ncbi:MAG: metal-dependent hydrolase [Mycobacterium leprae]
MAQVGLHAVTGLVVGEYCLRRWVPDAAARRGLLFGCVLGSMLPDLDYLAAAGVFPADPSLAFSLHRGFTHSLLMVAVVWLGSYLASLVMADAYARRVGQGLALGMLLHLGLDVLLWFGPVDLFWPASVYGLVKPINLWWWYQLPVLPSRLLGAAEFGAYGLYYDHLIRLADTFYTNRDEIRLGDRMATICWTIWAILTALAFDVTNDSFSLVFYVLIGILFLPACLYLTWRFQPTIEHLSRLPSGD